MGCAYLGTLDRRDPLYEVLLFEAYRDVKAPVFHVSRLARRSVYKYTEEKSRLSVVGKFFQLDDRRPDRIARIRCEYDNLHEIRKYGLDKYPNYVVRPIGRAARIGLALIEEFISGRDLDHYLKRAVYENDGAPLKDVLSGLASFFHVLHTKTKSRKAVDLDSISAYFRKVVDKLNRSGVLADSDVGVYLRLMDQWLNRPLLQDARSAIIHGDATPTNFIFTKGGDVVAIDLERMKISDVVYDVGMIAGEIKHAFLWRTGDPRASEPYIRHFLKSYARHFRDSRKAFRVITRRNPFYMALTELRIARNDYLDRHYRRRLALEALECLRWGLRL